MYIVAWALASWGTTFSLSRFVSTILQTKNIQNKDISLWVSRCTSEPDGICYASGDQPTAIQHIIIWWEFKATGMSSYSWKWNNLQSPNLFPLYLKSRAWRDNVVRTAPGQQPVILFQQRKRQQRRSFAHPESKEISSGVACKPLSELFSLEFLCWPNQMI